MKKLAVIITHPIQYYTPVFQLLAKRVDLMVFYTWGEASLAKYDPGFGKTIKWDIDLLGGYNFSWQKNTAKDPGSHHFYGIVNPDLIGEIVAWGPDAVLVYGWAYQSHLKVMRYFKGKVPLFFRGDSTLLDDRPGIKGTFKYLFLKWVYSHVDHVFYNGTNNKAYFKKYGLKEAQLSFAPHAIDNERFGLPRQEEVATLRHKLGLSPQNILIVYAGKFEHKKAPMLLLQAFLSLNDSNTHLLFVGNGILEAHLKAASTGNSNIHFMDVQNQTMMPAVYQAGDLFCLPSKGLGETWGLAVNEAMACSRAVLVSNKCGCAADIVLNDQNGYIFKSDDENDLLTCLKLITINKEKLSTFGQRSRNIIGPWNFTSIVAAIENQIFKIK